MFAYLITMYHINGSFNSTVNFYSLSIRWQNVLKTVWSSVAAKSTKNSLSVHFLTFEQQAVMPILVINRLTYVQNTGGYLRKTHFQQATDLVLVLSCFHSMKHSTPTSSRRQVALAWRAYFPLFCCTKLIKSWRLMSTCLVVRFAAIVV